jgi:hypothetical protein
MFWRKLTSQVDKAKIPIRIKNEFAKPCRDVQGYLPPLRLLAFASIVELNDTSLFRAIPAKGG